MTSDVLIRILASSANAKGDLFGRLMQDFLLALGYGDVRLNIQKTGREIDLEAHHRTEPRMVIAECKATRHKVGGDTINKFVGVLDAERHKRGKQKISGYFVSLTGFTETAMEQEQELGSRRLILVDGQKVVKELAKQNEQMSSPLTLLFPPSLPFQLAHLGGSLVGKVSHSVLSFLLMPFLALYSYEDISFNNY